MYAGQPASPPSIFITLFTYPLSTYPAVLRVPAVRLCSVGNFWSSVPLVCTNDTSSTLETFSDSGRHCWLGHLTRKNRPWYDYNVFGGTLNATVVLLPIWNTGSLRKIWECERGQGSVRILSKKQKKLWKWTFYLMESSILWTCILGLLQIRTVQSQDSCAVTVCTQRPPVQEEDLKSRGNIREFHFA